MTGEAQTERSAPRASLPALFSEFLKVSFLGFGGGIVWAHRIAVEQRAWLNEEDFADIISLCQFMPGPNIVGIAICTGAKLRGLAGAVAAFVGFALVPGAIGFALALLYLDNARLPLLQNILRGVSAVAAGLMIGTGLRLLRAQRFRPAAVLFAALAWTGIVVAKWPLLIVLLGLAPLSVAGAVLSRGRLR